ncbi:5-formyltetrahydrofolate cyclo-ligase [Actinoplanes tereljensis]|uniref:5-formyltetrahydrofolate cyclo-ligase n=1 Tax=Paractinoplanes tereljensis TaxID=571912 RepID=A0A919NSI5_9ACTN|nr:5-formyltetrahydrofolate cyclo-ligase [Actinoplanes tereljensis]GIF24354.1 5-formyltetrahydrofolate cyclo-ligase [Actinoplanes tereljensis]
MPDLTGGVEGSPAAKIALRNRLITARRHLTPSDRQTANTQLQGQILAFVRREHSPVTQREDPTPVRPSSPADPQVAPPGRLPTIAAYVPVGTEPGGADLPAVLAAYARVLLPVLLPDNDLDWVAYTGPSSLAPGPRGLREPTGPRLGPDAITTAGLILVPGLAVDRRGMRLGRGGGSYDRALARIPAGRTLVIALLHDGELVDEVPAEPHDRPVDAVITPHGVVGLSRATEWTK